MGIMRKAEGNIFLVRCPGCKTCHAVPTGEGSEPRWAFNGDELKPTFAPSLLVRWHDDEDGEDFVCHSFIQDGVWYFLDDCTHELKGQHVPMIEV